MGAGRRKFTKEFKEEAVRRLGLGVSLAEVARACEVNPNVLHRWRRELQEFATKAFAGNGQRRADDSQIAELERKVGRQALEIDFLRRCLQHVEEQRKLQAMDTRNSSIRISKKK
jgi:transposase-like protein